MKRSKTFAFAVVCTISSLGCAHQLEIVNEEEYVITPTSAPPKNVAILAREPTDPDSEVSHAKKAKDGSIVLFNHVVEALKRHPAVGRVSTNWSYESPEPDFTPDIVVSIDPQPSYEGSGWNFLITWPGFLVFLPAAVGLVYEAEVETGYTIATPRDPTSGATETAETSDTVTTDFELRHLDFGRAFWAESGWWMPGYSATALISGVYNMSFDKDAIEPFLQASREVYGNYVAEKIMKKALARDS